MSKSWIVLACVAALLGGSAAALAHAQLVQARPAADSVVSSAPTEVILQFNESLEGVFSSIRVRDASGQQVDKRDAHVEKSDPKVLRVSLPPLKSGSYQVQW
ncbi:MAG TPA: copper resistance CopC family protein, partial [Candidatus Methylomirabilis sp.]|nr:copper resistance CopC family protein [Candidatus Methylomirabilis sp.]